MKMSGTERTVFNNADLLSDADLTLLLSHARRVTHRALGAAKGLWAPEELLNETIATILERKQHVQLTEIMGVIITELDITFRRWTSRYGGGHNPDRLMRRPTEMQRAMSSVEIPADNAHRALQVESFEKGAVLEMDLERAFACLSPEEQQVVYWHFWEEKPVVEIEFLLRKQKRIRVPRIAKKTGRIFCLMTRRIMRGALQKLRAELDGYEWPARGDKRLRGSRGWLVLQTAHTPPEGASVGEL